MRTSGSIASAFEAVVILSLLATFAASGWIARGAPVKVTSRPSRVVALLTHPFAQFLMVCVVVWVNQILFNAYILRAHHGSAAFVKQYVGNGWFALAPSDPFVRFVASHAGDGQWLAPSLLRVQAFLELPFTLFAYLAVARMLGRDVTRALVRGPMLWIASVSFSITFSLVEIELWNPWTKDDLWLRALSAIVTPAWIMIVSRLEERSWVQGGDRKPTGVLGLLAFFVGAGAASFVVLALYDAFLLYNLGHLGRYAAGCAVAIPLACAASWAGPRIDGLVGARLRGSSSSPSSPGMDAMASALACFTILFFIPSLSLRYWGGHESANLGGVMLIVISACWGMTRAAKRAGGPWPIAKLVLAATIAIPVACVVGFFAAASAPSHALPELLLARAALAFLATAIGCARVVEIVLGALGVFWPAHEAKAEADEA